MNQRCLILILAIGAFFSLQAHATLGEFENSVEQDRVSMKGTRAKAQSTAKFTIHEMQVDGNTIRQFVGADGRVFAISWRGIKKPNLPKLLGSYFPEYIDEDSKRERPQGRHPVYMKTSRMVIHRGGHMRDVRGKVVATDLLPAGVHPEDLK